MAWPRRSAWSPAIAIRRRDDGGYTVAHGHHSRHPLVPASLRYGFKFLPALRASPDSVGFSLGADFFRALATPSRWPLDRRSPFESERVLNPRPEAASPIDALREAGEDGWSLWAWFASPSPWLGGRTPAEAMTDEPEAVADAARRRAASAE